VSELINENAKHDNKPVSVAALRMRRYRQKIKENEDRYTKYVL